MSGNRGWHKKQHTYSNQQSIEIDMNFKTSIHKDFIRSVRCSFALWGAVLAEDPWSTKWNGCGGRRAANFCDMPQVPFLHPLETCVVLTLLFSDIFRLLDPEDICKLGSTFSSNAKNHFLHCLHRRSHHITSQTSQEYLQNMSFAGDLTFATDQVATT